MLETGLSLDYLKTLDDDVLVTIIDIYDEQEKEMSRRGR